MKVEANKVVTAHYTLFNEEGEVLDSSRDGQPFTFMQGAGMVVRGFETALEGKDEKDSFSFTVKPEDGYGEHRDELVFELPKERLKDIEGLETGMALRMETPDGDMFVRVAAIGDETVCLDGNHPLAGVGLKFDVEVLEVREPTAEELDAMTKSSQGCGDSCGDTCCHSCGEGCE